MLKIKFTSQMKRDAKLQKRRGRDISLLETVLKALASRQPLPEQYDDQAARISAALAVCP